MFLLLGISLGNRPRVGNFSVGYNEQLRSTNSRSGEKNTGKWEVGRRRRRRGVVVGKGSDGEDASHREPSPSLNLHFQRFAGVRANNEFITALIRYKWHIWFAVVAVGVVYKTDVDSAFGRFLLLMRRRGSRSERETRLREAFVIADLSANRETSCALTTYER